MGFNISTDTQKIEQAANAIDKYISRCKKMMKEANATVNGLWQGDDYNAFISKWNGIDDKKSDYANLIKYLENYSELLRYAAKQYKDAQKKAEGASYIA